MALDGLTELERELRDMCTQMEPVTIRRPDQPPVTGSHPTYQAVLARHGYIVRSTIGSGSYSKVKMAVNVKGKGEENVAVKIIDRTKAPKDFQCKFLPRELKYWPELSHPHLLRLHDVFTDYRRVFMITEFASNGDVLRYIQDKGAINEQLARKWMRQVAEAVRYLHNRDISHRDLKLENLLLDSDRNVKICDFGFIKPHTSKDLSRTFCGSKSYAAPEILQGRSYDPKKSDIWAMGVILYIFITGKMPFDESKGTQSVLEEQRLVTLRWPTNKQPISEDCRNLIMRMLSWHFCKRPGIIEILNDTWFHPKSSAFPCLSRALPGASSSAVASSESRRSR